MWIDNVAQPNRAPTLTRLTAHYTSQSQVADHRDPVVPRRSIWRSEFRDKMFTTMSSAYESTLASLYGERPLRWNEFSIDRGRPLGGFHSKWFMVIRTRSAKIVQARHTLCRCRSFAFTRCASTSAWISGWIKYLKGPQKRNCRAGWKLAGNLSANYWNLHVQLEITNCFENGGLNLCKLEIARSLLNYALVCLIRHTEHRFIGAISWSFHDNKLVHMCPVWLWVCASNNETIATDRYTSLTYSQIKWYQQYQVVILEILKITVGKQTLKFCTAVIPLWPWTKVKPCHPQHYISTCVYTN